MIHRHWFAYSLIIAIIAVGGIIVIDVMLMHDALVEENVRLQQTLTTTMRSMQKEIDFAKRKYLACRVTAQLIAKESNGRKHARGFVPDANGYAHSYTQFKEGTWNYARKRYNKQDYDFGNFWHQFDLTWVAIMDNKGAWWTPCKDITECRKNFTEGGK